MRDQNRLIWMSETQSRSSDLFVYLEAGVSKRGRRGAAPSTHPPGFHVVAAAAAAQALHLANQPPQQQMYSALAPTPPSMTPGPNPQSPQASFPSAQQTVYIHPQQVQHGYNHNHMAHVQQVGSTDPPPHHSNRH